MLTINTGPEMAKILEQTRRSMNDLKTSVRRISSGLRIESAADDPGAIGNVTFSETAISGIQRTLRNLNEGITHKALRVTSTSLKTSSSRCEGELAASEQYTDLQRQDYKLKRASSPRSMRRSRTREIKMGSRSQRIRGSASLAAELSLSTQIVITDLLVEELGNARFTARSAMASSPQRSLKVHSRSTVLRYGPQRRMMTPRRRPLTAAQRSRKRRLDA